MLRAIIAILITVTLWASAFPAIKAALSAFSPTGLAGLRFLVAGIVLSVLAIHRRIGLPARADWLPILASGAIGIAIYNIALNTGELTVSPGAASVIINTSPIWTALLATTLFRERLSLRARTAIGVSFVGVALVAAGEEGRWPLGVGSLFILVAAVSQATFFAIQKPLLQKYPPLHLTCWTVTTGAICLAPFLPEALRTAFVAPVAAVAAAVYLGIFPGAIAYTSWSYALARYPASQAAAFLYLVPPIAVLIGAVWLAEIPTLQTIAGGAIAIGGVVMLNIRSRAV